MSKKSMLNCLEIGDKVRVKMDNGKPGATLWELTQKQSNGLCRIKEVHPTINYAAQWWHVDMLVLETSNERTAKAMNDSGCFKPFTMVGKDD